MKINPKELSWRGTSARSDGTPYLPSERHGYEVGYKKTGATVDNSVLMSVVAEDSNYVAPLSNTAALPFDTYSFAVRDIPKNGSPSDWSLPISVEFKKVYAMPEMPTSLQAT